VLEISVNGVPVDPDSAQTPELAAVREDLRQHARVLGLVAEGGGADAVNDAIRNLVKHEVTTSEPTEVDWRRYYDDHQELFQTRTRASARHILFQIASSAVAAKIRAAAEATLAELLENPTGFEAAAKKLSSCPSGRQGGRLGELSRGQTVPEFDRAVFETPTMGVLPDLVQTTFGFHIIAIDDRIGGQIMPFEQVANQMGEKFLRERHERAVREYIRSLVGKAAIVGIDLGAFSAH
jgi:peptidyl-prolyl cis-trans isomerase C